tara:strand:- start:252 stop:401 length:150 start_codon:yes stop_codon:yes gene_type:complete
MLHLFQKKMKFASIETHREQAGNRLEPLGKANSSLRTRPNCFIMFRIFL